MTGSTERYFETAQDCLDAMRESPGGRALGITDSPTSVRLTQAFAGPFFALRKLLPQALELERPVRVLFGGNCDFLAMLGGRYATLHGKAMALPKGFKLTFCTSRQPPRMPAKRELMFQPGQQVIKKPWPKVYADLNLEQPPDLILIYSGLGQHEQLRQVAELGRAPSKVRTVLVTFSRLQAQMLGRLLQLHGYTPGAHLHFPRTAASVNDQVPPFGVCDWFVEAALEGGADPLQPDPAALAQWQAAYRALSRTETIWPDNEEAAATLAFVGVRQAVQVQGQQVDAVMRHQHTGIDMATGREFGTMPDRSGYAWHDDAPVVPQPLLDRAPAVPSGDANASFKSRLETLAWLDMVDEESDQAQFADVFAPPAPEGEQPATGATPDPGQESVPEPLPPPSPAHGSPRHAEPAPQERPPRSWRLSREPGPVDALAMAALLGKPGSGTPAEVWAVALEQVVAWLHNKGFRDLRGDVSAHQNLPEGEATIETDGRSVWALRFDDRKQMQSGAIWRAELTLVSGLTCALGLRLYQIRSSASAPDPVTGVPAVVRAISDLVGMQDAGAPILPEARLLANNADLDWFRGHLHHIERSMALVVVTSTSRQGTDTTTDRLAARLTGLAHVVRVNSAMMSKLHAVLGTRHRVYGNAIRVYRPRFNEQDPPGDHPYWTLSEQGLSPRLANLIAEAVCAISVQRDDLEDRAPSFRVVRQILSEARLQTLRADAASIASTAEEERARRLAITAELERALADQKVRSDDLQARVQALQAELTAVTQERDDALDQGRRHRRAIQWMYAAEQDAPEEGSEQEETWYPDTWDDLETWVEVNGNDRLTLHPSAAKAARESPYVDIPLAYKALDLLANQYVRMRTRDAEDDKARIDFEQRLAELGLECSPVGTAVDQRRYKREYERIHEGRRIKLDMHLKKGVGFDPATLFRLYFHYCDESQRVVVGHLPGHLTNMLTHTG